MKILSWNVNGLRAIEKKGFNKWLLEEQPDIIGLQEIKAEKGQLSEEITNIKGYNSYFFSAKKPGYSGTAIYSKEKPLEVNFGLGVKSIDDEGRVIIAEYKDFYFLTAYFPNSQDERKRLPYKLEFCSEIHKYCDKLKKKKNLILCGDANVAHTEIDLARPKENVDNPGFYIEERTWIAGFLKKDYIDTFRHFCKEPQHYTWWSYRGGARERNVGWRIDYHFVNKEFINKIERAFILNKVMGSDHCPVGIEIKN